MATIDSFSSVTDGDVIADGWFNGARNALSIFGDSRDGAWTSTGSDTLSAGVHRYSSFNLQAGHTLTTTASSNKHPLIILVDGNATIAGTVNLQGKGLTSGTAYGSVASMPSTLVMQSSASYVGYRTFHKLVRAIENGQGPYSGVTGTDNIGGPPGVTAISHYLADTMYELLPLDFRWMLNGSNGGESGDADNEGGGGGGASVLNNGNQGEHRATGGTGRTAAAGANGGASFILICRGNLTVSGTINVKGNNGSNATTAAVEVSTAPASGGGGAGIIFLVYGGTFTDSGTYQYSGGVGTNLGTGAAGGAGGNGSAFFVKTATLFTTVF